MSLLNRQPSVSKPVWKARERPFCPRSIATGECGIGKAPSFLNIMLNNSHLVAKCKYPTLHTFYIYALDLTWSGGNYSFYDDEGEISNTFR